MPGGVVGRLGTTLSGLGAGVAGLGAGLSGLGAGLADLVVPGGCAGCGAPQARLGSGVCPGCVATLEAMRPYATAPRPAPSGLPPCVTVGAYGGALRGVLLAYKEKGRHRLARPLGALLAGAVAQAAGDRRAPLLVVPVPSTARAARQRHGDHLARLAGHAVRRLRAAGRPAQVVQALRALPRPDSAGLDTPGRAAAAESSLRIRTSGIGLLRHGVMMGGMLIVVDDIITTGATLAAVTHRLDEAELQVRGAAVLAATRRRR